MIIFDEYFWIIDIPGNIVLALNGYSSRIDIPVWGADYVNLLRYFVVTFVFFNLFLYCWTSIIQVPYIPFV